MYLYNSFNPDNISYKVETTRASPLFRPADTPSEFACFSHEALISKTRWEDSQGYGIASHRGGQDGTSHMSLPPKLLPLCTCVSGCGILSAPPTKSPAPGGAGQVPEFQTLGLHASSTYRTSFTSKTAVNICRVNGRMNE